jgi:hypothetical protein
MDTGGHKDRIAATAKVFLDYVDFIRKIICFYIHDEHLAYDMFQDFFLLFAILEEVMFLKGSAEYAGY